METHTKECSLLSLALFCLFQSYIIRFFIILNKIAPKRLSGKTLRAHPALLHLFGTKGGECGHRIFDIVGHLGIVLVRTMDDLHAILYFPIMPKLFVHP